MVVLLSTTVATAAITPSYSRTFEDAVTGDNEFEYNDDGTTRHAWFINTGADSYANDFYERPTVQDYRNLTVTDAVGNDSELVVGDTYSATGFSDPAYFGYLDIVRGKFGYDNQYMYFATELYSDEEVGNDGDGGSKFGDSSYYSIRFSEDPDGAGGLLLSQEDGTAMASSWQAEKTFAYYDEDGGVGGPGGITTPNEGLGAEPGYETVVAQDGKAKDASSDPEILWVRRIAGPGPDGPPIVEFAFDYAEFNHLFPSFAIDPAELLFLDYEAERGLKGQANYLWNDQYSFSQAGTPYDPSNEPQNIYELDTLRSGIPEPATMTLLAMGGLAMLMRKR